MATPLRAMKRGPRVYGSLKLGTTPGGGLAAGILERNSYGISDGKRMTGAKSLLLHEVREGSKKRSYVKS